MGRTGKREPFKESGVQEDVGSNTSSPGFGPCDSWPIDVKLRVAEFFILLDRWEREFRSQSPERKAE